MICEIRYGMESERYKELEWSMTETLTKEEIDKGWRFCCDWDGMLININDKGNGGEADCCSCVGGA